MSLTLVPTLFLLLTPESAADIAATPVSERIDPQYEDCVKRVFANIAEGRAYATRWTSSGGGAPAQHCLAIADLAAGHPKLAAARLEDLSERPGAGDGMVRARLLSQAADAYLEAQMPEEAARAVAAAFNLAPGEPELHLAAAAVHASLGENQATIDAATKAEKAGVVSSRGHVLRGRARYNLAQYLDAADDVVAALKLDPTNIDALTLRGDLAQQGVDIRADYSRAIKKKK
jgi:tetratricopeptide (TPR) repeat protein